MSEQESIDSGDETELPDKLIASMRQLVRASTKIDRDVDDFVLSDARRHLNTSKPSLTPHRRFTTARLVPLLVTLAATVLGAFLLRTFYSEDPELVSNAPVAIREDLDRSGHVDILDALILAQRVKEGGPLDSRWDINHDGTVDQNDVDRIASLAVRLKPADRKG